MGKHMNKILVPLAGAAILAVMSMSAQAQTCEQCGTLPPPPPPTTGKPPVPGPIMDPFVCRVRGNAGIGNKGEGRGTELNDCDPGRSGLHNQAWKNMDKHNNRR